MGTLQNDLKTTERMITALVVGIMNHHGAKIVEGTIQTTYLNKKPSGVKTALSVTVSSKTPGEG